jgi:methyl-accepting chemotaxis protein
MSLNTALLAETFKRAQTENGGARTLGLRFYERLFEKYPSVRPLFNTPPEEQHKKLMASIGAIVAGVNQTDLLVPYLRAMGIRHLAYKTEPDHYGAVGENLIAVLKEHLSQEGEWTDAMTSAWSDAINLIAGIMIEAANNPSQYTDELKQAGYQPDGFKENDAQPWLMAV